MSTFAEQVERMRQGEHIHFFNRDDPDDRMCSADPPCEGHDRIYPSEPQDLSCPVIPRLPGRRSDHASD